MRTHRLLMAGIVTALSGTTGGCHGDDPAGAVQSTPSVPASIVIASGNDQLQVQGGALLEAPLTVLVRDSSNTPLFGVSITYEVVSGNSSFSGLTSVVASTHEDGIASAIPTSGLDTGVNVITASVAGLPSVSFTFRIVASVVGDAFCALTTAKAAYCWGGNSHGAVGDGTFTQRSVPTQAGGALLFASLADRGAGHQCALSVTGAAYCWGFNGWGALGDGTTADRSVPTPVLGGLKFTTLSVGSAATCGLTATAALYCWGWAGGGIYGDSVLGITRTAPTLVNTDHIQMVSVSVGFDHLCGVATTALVYCWGNADIGKLGDGSDIRFPHKPGLVPSQVGGPFASVAAGSAYACALTPAGAGSCWGQNAGGQFGSGLTVNSSSPRAMSGALVLASIADLPNTTATGDRVCGLTPTGAAYCWGLNESGQIGDGTTTRRLLPVPVLGGITFTSLRVTNTAACGRATTGQFFCWGMGTQGEMGDGTFTSRLVPSPIRWVEGTSGVAVSIVLADGADQTTPRGASVVTPPSVLVRDYAGNPVGNVSVTFAVTSGDGSITGANAVTNASGIATVGGWTLGSVAGANTVTATIVGVGQVRFVATGT